MIDSQILINRPAHGGRIKADTSTPCTVCGSLDFYVDPRGYRNCRVCARPKYSRYYEANRKAISIRRKWHRRSTRPTAQFATSQKQLAAVLLVDPKLIKRAVVRGEGPGIASGNRYLIAKWGEYLSNPQEIIGMRAR
jgi:hypothetical protein